MNCPLCGSKVTYEGLNSIECEGAPKPEVPAFCGVMGGAPPRDAMPAQPACPNYRAPEMPLIPFVFPEGSFAWARQMWLQGYVLQVKPIYGDWTGEPYGACGQVMPNVDYGNRLWRIHPKNPFPVVSSRDKPEYWE